MNIVALVGNVASEPKLVTTSSGKAVCSFRLAVSRIGSENADFFSIVTWERQAQVCEQYLQIGRRIAVEGTLRHTQWKKDENNHSHVEVIAHRVELLGARPKEQKATQVFPEVSVDNQIAVV